ncbi:MAG TPA: hypothetical protein VHV74_04215 [Pseudonocardiaceae bacterium]|jgi:hypothetical protein|nr:hypothetical protein [Pseudonocardiaceae bacterium]
MAETLAFGVIILLIALALQRNHVRQRYHPATPAGSTTATDRDVERVAADLSSAATAADPMGSNRTSQAVSVATGHFAR